MSTINFQNGRKKLIHKQHKMGKFSTGQSGNPSGRSRKGRIKAKIQILLEKNLPVIEKEMETATPEVRREYFKDLAGVMYAGDQQTA